MQRRPPPYRRPPSPYEPYYGDNVYLHPLAPQPARRHPLGFGAGTLFYIGCIAVTLFFIWPYIRDGLGGGDPMHGPNSYDEYGWRGDPKRMDQSQRGGYSDYYPGSRSGGSDQHGGGHQQRMSLDPNEQDTIDDRRGEGRGRDGDLSRLGPPAQSQPTGGRYTDGRSADRNYPRRAEASHSGYQVRDCTGSWWNPFSEPGCGVWQDAPPPRSGGR
jgi:hypothetical protein